MKRELNFLSNGTKRVYLNEHSAFSRAFESWTCNPAYITSVQIFAITFSRDFCKLLNTGLIQKFKISPDKAIYLLRSANFGHHCVIFNKNWTKW